MVRIRPIASSDAEAFLSLCLALDSDTRTMMLEPGERSISVDDQHRRIADLRTGTQHETLVADLEGRLVGFIEIEAGSYRRNRHSASLALGVLRESRGQGIGGQLLSAAEGWARAHGLHRLELTVMVHNEPALRLYRSHGFCIEGTRADSLRVDGVFVDEFAMSKLLREGNG